MSQQSERPAAIWMDRLSDRIGSFIPGGSLLPARHPVKVSVVLGVLGLISGWSSMIAGAAANFLFGQHQFAEQPVFLVAGAVLAFVVVLPWVAWLSVRVRWFFPIVLYCVGANFAAFLFIEQYRDGKQVIGLFLFGLLTGLYLAALGLYLIQRFLPIWIFCTGLISAVGMCSFAIIKDNPLIQQLLPGDLEQPLIVAWFFSLIHTPSALCLGYLLWDTTPRPKFEAGDSVPAEAHSP